MKYNPKLEKKILEWCDKTLPQKGYVDIYQVFFDGYSKKDVWFNVDLLCKKGYINYHKERILRKNSFLYDPLIPKTIILESLSIEGEQYLKTIKNKFWKKVLYVLGLIVAVFFKDGVSLIFSYITKTLGWK